MGRKGLHMGLRVRDLTMSIGAEEILRGVSFDIADGEFVSLLGASGAGKSTVLKIISGILFPDSGSVEIGGRVVDEVPAHKRQTAVVFQDVRLFPNMTIEENVAFPLKMRKVGRRERLERARELLGLVHLEELGRRRVDEVSGGQQQRAALARALAAQPKVLLLDEPFSGLDESLRDEMRGLVAELHGILGTTTLHVTHDASEALMMSDRIVYLRRGEVVQVGTPQDLYERPATSEVASCFGDSTIFHGAIEAGVFRANELTVPCQRGCGAACSVSGLATAVVRHSGVKLAPGGTLEVLGSTYRGDTYLVRVSTGVNVLTARSAVAYEPGSRVDIEIEAGSLFVYPDSGAGNGPVAGLCAAEDEAAGGAA